MAVELAAKVAVYDGLRMGGDCDESGVENWSNAWGLERASEFTAVISTVMVVFNGKRNWLGSMRTPSVVLSGGEIEEFINRLEAL